MAPAPVKSLMYSLQDSLMLLAPRGWRQVDLKFVRVGAQLRLNELETRGEGSAAPKERAPIDIDLRQEAAHLSEGLTELVAHVCPEWAFGIVKVDRTEDFVDWKLMRPNGSTAWFTRISRGELDELLITEALFDLVLGNARAFGVLQQQLTERLGAVSGFAYDTSHSMLRLSRAGQGDLELRALVLGAYLSESYTWVWSWADPDANPQAVEAVRAICAPDAHQAGLSALARPNYHCEEPLAWAVAGSVGVSAGARGIFRGELPDGSGAAFFAIMELPPLRA